MNTPVLCTIIVDETVSKVPKCGERYFLVAKNKHTSIPRRAARRTSEKRIEYKIGKRIGQRPLRILFVLLYIHEFC
jgi:ribosomal protein S30